MAKEHECQNSGVFCSLEGKASSFLRNNGLKLLDKINTKHKNHYHHLLIALLTLPNSHPICTSHPTLMQTFFSFFCFCSFSFFFCSKRLSIELKP